MKKKTLKGGIFTALVAALFIMALSALYLRDIRLPIFFLNFVLAIVVIYAIYSIYSVIVYGYALKGGDSDIKKNLSDLEGEYGFIDKTGNVVIPCKWKGAGLFSEGLAPVQDDSGKWWTIDKTGKVVK